MSLASMPVSKMRIVYIGARVVGYQCLLALLKAGANVAGLLTLDESKAHITTSYQSFDELISNYHLNSRTFKKLNTDATLDWVKEQKPHLGIVVGVSQLIGEGILEVPPLGFIGMHPTLLPEGRGRAPIPWAIIKGLKQTGVSLFYCKEDADTGDLLAQETVPTYYEDTSATLGARTDEAAARLLISSIPKLASGKASRIKQDEDKATCWSRRRPEDGEVDWTGSKRQIYDWVRALTHPYPGAFTTCQDKTLWIWGATESDDPRSGRPGEVLDTIPMGVLVATGQGNLLVTQVQWKGCKEVKGSQSGLFPGDTLGAVG